MTYLTREHTAPVIGLDREARRVTVRLCRWNEAREVSDGGELYREAFPPDSLELAADVHVVDHHHGDLIGRADTSTYSPTDSGPTVELVLARTAAASDTLALIEADVIRSVSMELEPIDTIEADGITYRTRSRVHGVAFAFRPAHTADILELREQLTTTTTTTTTEQTMTTDDTTTSTAVPAVPAVPQLTRGDLDTALDDMRREVIAAMPAVPSSSPTLLREIGSVGEYADRVYSASADDRALLHRALADQITANNAGVIPEPWVADVQGIVNLGRPLITAIGSGPLPGAGMSVDYPYFDGDLSALIAPQATEKTEINSVRVDLKRGSANIETYAGGSDISYQLIRRSSPSYLDAYMRIMYAAYALTTDAAAAADATIAAATAGPTWDGATGTLPELVAALFGTSVEVEGASGLPASFALAGSTIFGQIAGLDGLVPPAYGTQNVGGVAQASTLRVEVSGLPVIHDRNLAADALLVGNPSCGDWLEDGPMPVSAEDIERLGQNVAVWGMGTYTPLNVGALRAIAAA